MFFLFVKTSGYHLKVFIFKLNQIHICQTTIVEKHLRRYNVRRNSMNKSISWQIMVHFARIKSDKEKHPQINHVEETDNVKWCVFKDPQYSYMLRQQSYMHLDRFHLMFFFVKECNGQIWTGEKWTCDCRLLCQPNFFD